MLRFRFVFQKHHRRFRLQLSIKLASLLGAKQYWINGGCSAHQYERQIFGRALGCQMPGFKLLKWDIRDLPISLFFIQIALAQKPFDQARSFLDKADYTSCTRILDSCHAAKYHSDSVLFYLGLVKFKTDNIEAGQRYIALLNKEYPDFNEVHYPQRVALFLKKIMPKVLMSLPASLKRTRVM